jgi:hypothetical protein
MSSKLVQNASKDNKAQTINYCLTNEPCNRRRNTTKHLNISLHVVTQDNSSTNKKRFLDLQACKKIQTLIKNSRNIIYSKIRSNQHKKVNKKTLTLS